MIQCVMSSSDFRACASGSCSIRTKLAVPAGGFAHVIAGDTEFVMPTAQVYLSGTIPPSLNAVVEIVSGGPGGGPPPGGPPPGRPPPGPPGGGPCWPKAGAIAAASKNPKVVSGRAILIPSFLPMPLLEKLPESV